ncbi:MAG: efflux RND transporter periplasmic adaptor subunit [Patescibacteria group bacterium]|nr:efflux RND transporter periplasmic adaptor subunit [Patescibacteria group bacterium]MDE1965920.1 efflux RND transporter periplasmic adaptor subunit [Patescibacteria group bacterium]
MTSIFKKLVRVVLALPRRYSIGGAAVVVVAVAVGVHLLAPAAVDTASVSGTSHVRVASVASLSAAAGPLPVTGKITSVSRAAILAETSGEIVTLAHALGDRVAAGTVIAAFENSSQQAAVEQAQGAYDASLAALAKLNDTTAANSSVTSGQAAVSAANAKTGAFAALSSAYAALDDAIHTRADLLFSNPRSASPVLSLTVPDSILVTKLQNERTTLESGLADANKLANDTSDADIDANSTAMVAHAKDVAAFLDDLIKAVSETPPGASATAATLAADQTSLAAARAEAIAAITSVSAAKNAYDAAVAGATTAANSASGGTENDIKAAEANVTAAEGALNAAKANLEKTIVRSPISGTIVSLPITQGGYVSAYTEVAVVSNPGALYADVQVTPDDARTLSVGNAATLAGSVPGVITFVAPALDPSTGKIEVKVGVTGEAGALTDGEVVSASLDRTASTSAKSAAGTDVITIPINAAKLEPNGAAVFTVTASSTLAAVPITLGAILGDRVAVPSGLSPSLEIVTDARGLSEGQAVIVDPGQ